MESKLRKNISIRLRSREIKKMFVQNIDRKIKTHFVSSANLCLFYAQQINANFPTFFSTRFFQRAQMCLTIRSCVLNFHQ